ncbi:MAG: hypothetical protein ACTIL2_03635, partial [Corynebacterium sp.]|uniref:hypothetical protein n=1 Tax=Corynebacterium sp. TaxID=1720 RepID=UPI003F9711FC
MAAVAQAAAALIKSISESIDRASERAGKGLDVSAAELARSIADDAFTRDIAVHQQVLGTALDEPEV